MESELKSPDSVSRFKGWRASLLLMFNPFDTKALRFVELAFDIRFTLNFAGCKNERRADGARQINRLGEGLSCIMKSR